MIRRPRRSPLFPSTPFSRSLQAGQSVLVHGATGSVGSMVTQLAREFGAYVIGTGRATDRHKALDFGAAEFVDLEHDALEDRSEEHTSELQSQSNLVCRLLLE